MTMGVIGTSALAAALYLLGSAITKRMNILRQGCIPAAVVGGLLFAIFNTGLYVSGNTHLTFHGEVQTFLMVAAFTCMGVSVRFERLKAGGRMALVALILAGILALAKNVLGAGVLMAFGEDARFGFVAGTTGVTFGLVMGSLMGGPAACFLIRKYGLSGHSKREEVPVPVKMGKPWYRRMFIAVMILFCMAISYVLSGAVSALLGITFPWFVASMLVGVLLRSTTAMSEEEFPDDEAHKIGKVCLCGFLSMVMMSLQLWELTRLTGPMWFVLVFQTVLAMVFCWYIVFPKLGGDYDAAVMTAGFLGFSIGAAPNAVANIQAASREYGPSPMAFFVIPLVSGVFFV